MLKRYLAIVPALIVGLCATEAAAQYLPASPLLSMPRDSLNGEIGRRYDAALQLTQSPQVVNANTETFFWASEAKVNCGIALGFLKTKTIDEDSINRCDLYATRMSAPPPPPMPPPPEPAAACTVQIPIVVYFGWDIDSPPPEAQPVIAEAAQSMAQCGWTGLLLAGHADRSGSAAYNVRLSERRARNVADMLISAGVSPSVIMVDAKGESSPAVPTADNVREPLNRRVEISPTNRP